MTHVVTEVLISSSGIPQCIVVPALIAIGAGMNYIARRRRQRKLKK